MAIRGDIEETKWQEEEMTELSAGLKQKLATFQDMKLGVIMHWGLYAEAGIVESWQLSEEDTWARKEPWREDLSTLREDYWGLSQQFNPVKFDPADWAKKCRAAGFKYLLFTTKHHDGFNLYDTALSDYKITAPELPFASNPQSDILKAIFDAFRSEDMTVGAYYSKADWHSPYYWVPGQHAVGRQASYEVSQDPEMWERFVQFVHGQLHEIMSDYGKIDILWLDAGWVGPDSGEDLRMGEIAENLRLLQKDLIMVDRTIGGAYENYVTPERAVPDIPPNKVWESNIPLANNWGYVPDDTYKSLKQIIHLLVQVVAKGGNLILGVGPKPDGSLPLEAEKLMAGLGQWLSLNGEGIYGTRMVSSDNVSNWLLTQKADAIYAFALLEDQDYPLVIDLRELGIDLAQVRQVDLLATGVSLLQQKDQPVYLIPAGVEQDALGIRIKLS